MTDDRNEKRRRDQFNFYVATELMELTELDKPGIPWVPNYIDNWDAAFSVVEKMRRDGYVFEMRDRRVFHNSYRDAHVVFVKDRHVSVQDNTNTEVTPELVCRAALRAKGLNHMLYQKGFAS